MNRQQCLIVLTWLLFCTTDNDSKHIKQKCSKNRLYRGVGNSPHYHVFFDGKSSKLEESSANAFADDDPAKPPKSFRGSSNSRSLFGPLGGVLGIDDDDLGDPLLASSKHYTLGIPFHVGGTPMFPQVANYEITDFTFKRCDDGASYPITFQYFELEFPAKIPGHVKVNFNATTTHDLIAPIEVHFEGFKGILGAMVKFPCILGLGSCIYNDGCQIFRYDETGGCPRSFRQQNIPCACPYPRGIYTAHALDYSVYINGLPEVPGPTPFTDGSYMGRMRLKKDGELLMCAEAIMVVRSV